MTQPDARAGTPQGRHEPRGPREASGPHGPREPIEAVEPSGEGAVMWELEFGLFAETPPRT